MKSLRLIHVMVFACALRGETIYSNLGDPVLYKGKVSRNISTNDVALLTITQGFRFTALTTAVLEQIELGVAASRKGTLTANLWTDGVTGPGDLLGSWDFTTTERPGQSDTVLTTLATPGGPKLTAGVNYILTLAPRGTGVAALWHDSYESASVFFAIDNGPWESAGISAAGAARLTGSIPTVTTVPEPVQILTLGGVLVLAVSRRRRWRR
ncbi:hypothetical protein F183_A11250 [Bryobacterales bacterium F-183]|nr:hypothetical protein F183_A11250 [Bryobacterales bacterium F-183]